MDRCPHTTCCDLYAQFTLDQMRRFWIARYCEQEGHRACARIQLLARGEPVPATLLPNGKDLGAPLA